MSDPTQQQDQMLRELRKINRQLNPLPSFIRLALWIALGMAILGIPAFIVEIAHSGLSR
jgi:hypothetical protein